MKKSLIYLLVIISITSCTKNSEELPVVPFDNFNVIDLNHEIPLDSIVSKTEIIRFSADSALVIGNISLVYESKEHLYVIADGQIMQFNKAGKLVNLLGRQGEGPGEYLYARDMDVDEENQLIYVMDYFGQKMLYYNLDGTFEGSFDTPVENGIDKEGFSLYKGNILYTSNENSISPVISIYNQDKDELVKVSIANRETPAGEAFMGTNFIYENKEEPYLFYYFNDTVFSIETSKLEPAYLLKFGNLKIQL